MTRKSNPYRSPEEISVDVSVEPAAEPMSGLEVISQCSILFGALGLSCVYFVDRHELSDWLRFAIGAVSLVAVGLGIHGLRRSREN
ncbi:hypothetical protein Enr13x_57190 [Stieleria neptunia]|uniref:DUF202 domain-containing protein n=1 Tax=Stieleria neptunia TaxID=2527979 RepID=A0A518HY88_9BACT|nr:hypothetical protein Enr13x_57190 [Stieleria neptunia]